MSDTELRVAAVDALADVFRDAPLVPLSDRLRVRHLQRVRLETKPGRATWTIVEVWATGHEGPVRVDMPAWELPRENMTWELYRLFTQVKRYAKIMGIADDGVLVKTWL